MAFMEMFLKQIANQANQAQAQKDANQAMMAALMQAGFVPQESPYAVAPETLLGRTDQQEAIRPEPFRQAAPPAQAQGQPGFMERLTGGLRQALVAPRPVDLSSYVPGLSHPQTTARLGQQEVTQSFETQMTHEEKMKQLDEDFRRDQAAESKRQFELQYQLDEKQVEALLNRSRAELVAANKTLSDADKILMEGISNPTLLMEQYQSVMEARQRFVENEHPWYSAFSEITTLGIGEDWLLRAYGPPHVKRQLKYFDDTLAALVRKMWEGGYPWGPGAVGRAEIDKITGAPQTGPEVPDEEGGKTGFERAQDWWEKRSREKSAKPAHDR